MDLPPEADYTGLDSLQNRACAKPVGRLRRVPHSLPQRIKWILEVLMSARFRRASRWMIALGVVLVVSALPLFAGTITVTSNADAGGTCPGATCTLRQAIATAGSGD